ncbi:MAG: YicC family protein, partial [Firmicutes bacterium]|nr:YicC family protein [Bacillota bacterium]
MLRSMTGYGKAVASAGGRAAVVEVRTVNHRFLDLAVRLPRGFAPVEHRVRQVVQDRIRRGRVEVAVSVDDPTPAAPRVRVDTD